MIEIQYVETVTDGVTDVTDFYLSRHLSHYLSRCNSLRTSVLEAPVTDVTDMADEIHLCGSCVAALRRCCHVPVKTSRYFSETLQRFSETPREIEKAPRGF